MSATLSHELDAKCASERLWEILADLTAVAGYNPSVKTARIRGGRSRGLGAERECDLLPSGKVVERVVVWEDGRSLGLEVVESDWPIASMRWVTRVEPRGSGCRLTQRLEYKPKFGPLGWLLNKLVMQRKIAQNVDAALKGLIREAEGRS